MTQVDSLKDWETSSKLEWLATNGIGGYASSSISGANTRRYHGLLVAACKPPLGRAVLLSKLEEEIRVEDQHYHLSANKYPHVIYPQGFRHLLSFTSSPIPTFLYSIDEIGLTIQKQIWLAREANTVYVRYTVLKSSDPFQFSLLLFAAYKDYHSEQRHWDGFQAKLDVTTTGKLTFTAFDQAIPLHIKVMGSSDFQYHKEPEWYFNYEHEWEELRGQDSFEDLYNIGRFDGILTQGDTVTFVATTEDADPALPYDALEAESTRIAQLLKKAKLPKNAPSVVSQLVLAADQFVAPKSKRVSRATIIAGYPWFTDWGRDTMISLSGLTLATRRYDIAKQILASFAGAIKDGLIPNRFRDDGEGAEYNTVDATLWLFQAARSYAVETGDWQFLTGKLYDSLESVIEHHISGTIYNIHVDPEDGLLYAGEPSVALTWMDAKTGDIVVTPRVGKPVEIQALWYNALQVFAEISEKADKPTKKYLTLAAKVKRSFKAKFVSPNNKKSLLDVVDGPTGDDPSVRPNQLFALTLAYPVFDPKSRMAAAVLKTVEDELLTPKGLRTLSPNSPNYKGKYGPGDQRARDLTYHQGTVWPWLFGVYADAAFAVRGEAPIEKLLIYAEDLLKEFGVGSIAEIYDGDEPQRPNGCIAQAWSVAEILRVLLK